MENISTVDMLESLSGFGATYLSDEALGEITGKLGIRNDSTSRANVGAVVRKEASKLANKAITLSTATKGELTLIRHSEKFNAEQRQLIADKRVRAMEMEFYCRSQFSGTSGVYQLIPDAQTKAIGTMNLETNGLFPANTFGIITHIGLGYALDTTGSGGVGTLSPSQVQYNTMDSVPVNILNGHLRVRVGDRPVTHTEQPVRPFFGGESGSIITGISDDNVMRPLIGEKISFSAGERLYAEIMIPSGSPALATGRHFVEIRLKVMVWQAI